MNTGQNEIPEEIGRCEYVDDGIQIYVASLAHYNAGQLVGKWFDATQDDLVGAVHDYIKSLTCYGQQCEEWAIHDYEGFGMYSVSEYEGIKEVNEIALAIEEHGEAVGAWLMHSGSSEFDLSSFEDCYRGEWDSEQAYAEELFDDIHAHEVPVQLRFYIDYERFTRDLFISDCWSAESGHGTVYVFWNN